MADEVIKEKVYCHNNDNSALMAAMMGNRNNDPMAMAAMMNGGMGGNQWLNNPFLYLIFLAMFGGSGGESLRQQRGHRGEVRQGA